MNPLASKLGRSLIYSLAGGLAAWLTVVAKTDAGPWTAIVGALANFAAAQLGSWLANQPKEGKV